MSSLLKNVLSCTSDEYVIITTQCNIRYLPLLSRSSYHALWCVQMQTACVQAMVLADAALQADECTAGGKVSANVFSKATFL